MVTLDIVGNIKVTKNFSIYLHCHTSLTAKTCDTESTINKEPNMNWQDSFG